MKGTIKGSHLTDDHKQSIRRALKGHAVSEATREKITKGMMGNKNSLGHIFTQENLENMRKAQKARQDRNRALKVEAKLGVNDVNG
jgi:hypothetical protein